MTFYGEVQIPVYSPHNLTDVKVIFSLDIYVLGGLTFVIGLEKQSVSTHGELIPGGKVQLSS